MDGADLDERRQRLASIAASQRAALAHDWLSLKHAVSPERHVRRFRAPLALGGTVLIGIWAGLALRKRLQLRGRARRAPPVSPLIRREAIKHLSPLLPIKPMELIKRLPRLWALMKIPGVADMVRRLILMRFR